MMRFNGDEGVDNGQPNSNYDNAINYGGNMSARVDRHRTDHMKKAHEDM